MDAPASQVSVPSGQPLADLVRTEGGRRRRRIVLRLVLLGGAIAVAAVVAILLWPRAAAMADRFGTEAVTRGELRRRVSANGRVEVRRSVDIGAQVSGRIAEVLVDYDDRVTAGQVLARFETDSFRAQLTEAKASVAAARAESRRADLEATEAQRDARRADDLFARGVIGRAELDTSHDRVDQALARRAAAHAQVTLQAAALALAQTTMDHGEIRSPIDGIVLARQVEPGQTVAATFQSPVLFVVVEDLAKMRVLASVDEADIGAVAEGQQATFTVDAYPTRTFTGALVELRSAPHLVQNVVTYDAVIEVDNQGGALKPGMTASAEIETAAATDVLRVPNGALHFRPPEAAAGEGDAIWILTDEGPTRVPVTVGISDGVLTSVEGEVHEGDRVITELTPAGRKAYGLAR